MRNFYLVLIIFLLFIFSACEVEVESNPYEPEIVLEGVVEYGKCPVVVLSLLIPVGTILENAQKSSIPIRWAKVTVSDGVNEEVLVGMTDANSLFKYKYSALHMKGEIGKTYTLRVEYSGRVLTATTKIPKQPDLYNIEVYKLNYSDSLYSIKVHIDNIPNEKNYYLFQVKQNIDTDVFRPSFFGAIEDNSEDEDFSVIVYNSMRMIKGYSLYFNSKKTYVLKFCQIGELEYAFWNDYFNQIIAASNPIYPNVSNLSTNINGGLGIFYGCASRDYLITIP